MDNGVMHHNPLTTPILSLLRESPEGLSEHELIKRLARQDSMFAGQGAADGADLALFRKHFLVMNALYQLQGSLCDAGQALRIDPLLIVLVSGAERGDLGERQLAGDEALRRYYLDWDNLHQTSESDVAALLQGFWDLYHAVDRQADALTLLGLAECAPLTLAGIQRRYRQLATLHHPDKGGEPALFIEIREAYELLSRSHGKAR